MLLVVSDKNSLDEKHASTILKELLKADKPVYLSSLQTTIKNYYALQNTVLKLAEDGYIQIIEDEYRGRPAKLLELTEKGKAVAEALKQAEWLSKLPPEKIEQFAQMRALIHVNMYEDHVSVQDIHLGKVRIVNVFVRPKGEIIHFYCDFHDSDDCYHVEYLFADAHLSEYIQGWLKRNGYRLAEKYEKYVEKYW